MEILRLLLRNWEANIIYISFLMFISYVYFYIGIKIESKVLLHMARTFIILLALILTLVMLVDITNKYIPYSQ